MELTAKPPKTIVNDLNSDEWHKFKERRKFDTWRDKGHFYFDKLWRDLKVFSREEAYEWLADKLKIDNAHFGNLNNTQCSGAVFYCQQLLNDLRRLDLDFGDEPKTPFYILEH